MKDELIIALAKQHNFRAYALTATNLVETARLAHDLWPTASAALGRTLIVGAMLGQMLKAEQEKLTITINGGGPLGTILVDAFSDGRVRGFVGEPHILLINPETGKLAVGEAVGTAGYLKVIKDQALKGEFTGLVKLVSGEIGEDFAYYFLASEQIPTALSVGVLVNPDYSIASAGGLLLQMLPEANEADITYVENLVANLPPISSLVQAGLDAQGLLDYLNTELKLLEVNPLKFECNCSKQRFAGSLQVLAPKDLQELMQDPSGAEIICNYCNTHYQFNPAELQEIYHDKMAHH